MCAGTVTEVAVVIPSYDTAPYVARCLRSLQAQDMERWECFVVDDCSTDGTPDVVQAVADGDRRIHLIRRTDNAGCGIARREAIAAALSSTRARWMALVDSDDAVEPRYLSAMMAAARSTGAEAVCCGTIDVDDRGRELRREAAPVDYVTSGEGIYRDYMRGGWVRQYNGNKLFARRLVEAIPYSPLRFCEDSATTYLWLDEAVRVAVISDALYRYTRRRGSNSNTLNAPLTKAVDTVACVAGHYAFCRARGYGWMLPGLRAFAAPHIMQAVAALRPGDPRWDVVDGARRGMF